jgi:transcriptional regulator with XRE-family HTH domain
MALSITPFGDKEALELLGERLKRERLRRNQTQTEAAKWAGVARNTFAKLEAGDGSIQLRVLARVLSQLGFIERLPHCVPDSPLAIDFDEESRLAERQRARPSKAKAT